jgi:hypothetical protein
LEIRDAGEVGCIQHFGVLYGALARISEDQLGQEDAPHERLDE